MIVHSDSKACFSVSSERIYIDFGVALSRVNVLLGVREMRRFEFFNFYRYRQLFRCVAAGGQRESGTASSTAECLARCPIHRAYLSETST